VRGHDVVHPAVDGLAALVYCGLTCDRARCEFAEPASEGAAATAVAGRHIARGLAAPSAVGNPGARVGVANVT
jgi:hypothetical protein